MSRSDLSVERVRHHPKMRMLIVSRVERVAGLMARVTFTGSTCRTSCRRPSTITSSCSFRPIRRSRWSCPASRPTASSFPTTRRARRRATTSPRHFDAARQELVIDFVMHGDGPEPTWAERAAPGQVLGIGGPRGSFVVPMGFDWHVLIGDETALPAISRRIEELPASAQVIALIEVPDADNEIALDTRARASVRWLHRNGVAAGYSTLLLEAARELKLPEGEGYVWVAAESATLALREIMVGQHGVDSAASARPATGSAASRPCTSRTTTESCSS